MADTDSSGSGQDWKQAELRTTGTEQSSVDNGKPRTGKDEEVEEGKYRLNEPRQMADTSSKGRIRVRRSEKEERIKTTGTLPLYPPGPGDRDGWARLIARFPELEPTFCKEGHMLSEMQKTESCIHRTLNGPTTGVDLRLRAVGNGVVPAVAARAFRELANKLKKDGNFPNILYDDRTLAKRCEINHGGQ